MANIFNTMKNVGSDVFGSAVVSCPLIKVTIKKVAWKNNYMAVAKSGLSITERYEWTPINPNNAIPDPDNFVYDGCSKTPAVYFTQLIATNTEPELEVTLEVDNQLSCSNTIPDDVIGLQAILKIDFNGLTQYSEMFNLPNRGANTTVSIKFFKTSEVKWLKGEPSFTLFYGMSQVYSIGRDPTNAAVGSTQIYGKNNVPINLEMFILHNIPASFYKEGVWVEALRFLFEKIKVSGSSIPDNMSKITRYLHSQHGLQYNTVNGDKAFCREISSFGIAEFNLMGYLKKRAKKSLAISGLPDVYGRKDYNYWNLNDFQDFNVVNCYDQATAVHALAGALGIYTEYVYIDNFGYIPELELVGINSDSDYVKQPSKSPTHCDNPFFSNKKCSGYRIVGAERDKYRKSRSTFLNHAVCGLLLNGRKYSEYTVQKDYENDVLIYDACAGPSTGASYHEYISKAIDDSLTRSSNYEHVITYTTFLDKVKWYDV